MPFQFEIETYFAAHAPAEIPEWFVHVPTTPRPEMINSTAVGEADRDLVRNWMNDGMEDLPDRLAWYQFQWTEQRARTVAWERSQVIARYYQWRWAYARAMVAEGAH